MLAFRQYPIACNNYTAANKKVINIKLTCQSPNQFSNRGSINVALTQSPI